MKASAPSLRVVSAQPQYGSTRPPLPKRQHHRPAGGTAHIVRASCKHLMPSSAFPSSAPLHIHSVLPGGYPIRCKALLLGHSISAERRFVLEVFSTFISLC